MGDNLSERNSAPILWIGALCAFSILSLSESDWD